MNGSPVSDSTLGVVKSLQDRLKTIQPGSRAAEATEQAITYALSTKRQDRSTQFLQYDVLRDAYRAVDRRGAAQQRLVNGIAAQIMPSGTVITDRNVRISTYARSADRAPVRPGVLTSGGGGTAGASSMVTTITPEDHAVSTDLEQRLRQRLLRDLGPLAALVFDTMVDNDTVHEAAATVGVSTSTIDRCRARIRAVVTTYLHENEVAA